jgi:flavin-binding protein dodecin
LSHRDWREIVTYVYKEHMMSDRVYKKIELTGTSTTSLEEAIENAIDRASSTIRKMRWFEVVETRGRIDDGKVAEWQVTLKVGFAMDD